MTAPRGAARRVLVRGIVQGVGFRPFVYRLAHAHALAGWVLNGADGVAIHVEGDPAALDRFVAELSATAPPASRIAAILVEEAEPAGAASFVIRESVGREAPTVRIAPDLPVCAACLAELRDAADRRHAYPYVNCTDCGPRFSIVLGLPYDRPRTTMASWPLCEDCAREYHDPRDRRFHAQPVACPACGPHVVLERGGAPGAIDAAGIAEAAQLLGAGAILAVKGLGGYHLACDARNDAAVRALRERKYRKERPFALLAKDLATARSLVDLDADGEALLCSAAAPIVLAPARAPWPEVAPGTCELGVMLPYTPLQHMLFDAGAPVVLVMTSANRSSEPIAYEDDDARAQLGGIADAFLVGERPIARRVDDSVARAGVFGPTILRRARGYSPAAVGRDWPAHGPVLALGADLKNSVTLVVHGQAFVGQHVGDLDHLSARESFEAIARDLCAMYDIPLEALTVVHDAHPDYVSTQWARTLPGSRVAVQHHRAHVASVLAERGAWDTAVVGVSFDGTGWGDDGAIWGGEVFTGSLAGGLARAAHLREARLPGGDAAAAFPPQAAAGFLAQLDGLPDLTAAPLALPARYALALDMVRRDVRCHTTTSIGRLFDAVAALCGFVRPITYEGQAAIWLEQLALQAPAATPSYPAGWDGPELDFRPVLAAVLADRLAGRSPAAVARAFHGTLADLVSRKFLQLSSNFSGPGTPLVLSGGVFQNHLLLQQLAARLGVTPVWVNHEVPPNDGGISLGQAALALARPAREA